jgi:hypothetical protein
LRVASSTSVTPHGEALAAELSPHLAHAIGVVVVLVDTRQLRLEPRVTLRPFRRWPAPGRVVRRRGDLQRRADRLDPVARSVLLDVARDRGDPRVEFPREKSRGGLEEGGCSDWARRS